MEKWKKTIIKHPFWIQILLALTGGFAFSVAAVCKQLLEARRIDSVWEIFPQIPAATLIIGFFVAYPLVISLYELVYLIFVCVQKDFTAEDITRNQRFIAYDIWVLYLAVLFAWLYMDALGNVVFGKNWYETLVNAELHAPIYTESYPTIIAVVLLFTCGLFVFWLVPLKKRPPLLTVLAMASLYLGCIVSVLFTIHILGFETKKANSAVGSFNYIRMNHGDLLIVGVVTANLLLISARIIILQVKQYQLDENRDSKIQSEDILMRFNSLLNRAKYWPVIAFVIMWPLLGILIGIMVLCGQAPDAIIKAFTETADYTFSTRIPPQNIMMDEHYLCTVAAGGHEKVVKPLRMGRRHGHEVVVNRQLCVANAFEQILEEKTPHFHRVVRNFYDRYGFPVARLIKSKWIADFIWFLMKPLEWVFVAVIYLVDVHPEDRIASQYLK